MLKSFYPETANMRIQDFIPSARSLMLFLLFSFSLVACQKDLNDPDGGSGSNPPNVDQARVNAGIRGVVVDENNMPVVSATVISGTNTTTTDRFGNFRFTNISLSRNNGYVKVEKAGYFTGSRSFVTTEGRTHNVRIQLIRKTITGSFAGGAGGTVNLTGGGTLVMPPAAVTDLAGVAYTGSVNISMTWIDPSSPSLPDIMPGDLRGITTAGEEQVLETYGMMGVEMTGSGGQSLKIASGQKAELNFPIPSSLQGSAPATIDLWHFDEVNGRWRQEGQAVRTGSFYKAQVSHFSFWNCDVPFPLVDLCMTLVNQANNQPLNNVGVRIERATNQNNFGYGRTDSVGNICGKVPKNEPLILEVLGTCGDVIYSQNIGPFASNTSLGVIAVPLPATNTLTITGTLVDCANAPVTHGAVTIYTNNSHSYSVPVTNGTFTLTLIRCMNASTNFGIVGFNIATLQQSTMFTGSAGTGTFNTGPIRACGTTAEYIEYILDGTPYIWIDIGFPYQVETWDSLMTPSTPFMYKTAVSAIKDVGANNIEQTCFSFKHNSVAGTVPFSTAPFETKFSDGNWLLTHFVNPNPTLNITRLDTAPGGYIEGNFTHQVSAGPSGTVHNLSCYFRVKR